MREENGEEIVERTIFQVGTCSTSRPARWARIRQRTLTSRYAT
jgi:hypothetical protein